MNDIVERLLDATDRDRIDDAISEITTLRAEVERLRAALRHISALAPNQGNAMQIKARAALAQKDATDE